jgi:hypothetical protein
MFSICHLEFQRSLLVNQFTLELHFRIIVSNTKVTDNLGKIKVERLIKIREWKL